MATERTYQYTTGNALVTCLLLPFHKNHRQNLNTTNAITVTASVLNTNSNDSLCSVDAPQLIHLDHVVCAARDARDYIGPYAEGAYKLLNFEHFSPNLEGKYSYMWPAKSAEQSTSRTLT